MRSFRIHVLMLFCTASVAAALGPFESAAQPFVIEGHVTDTNEQPLIQATLHVQALDAYAVTDENGQYQIELDGLPADRTVEINVRYVGMRSETRIVSFPDDSTRVTEHVVMQPRDLYMSEVTVTAERGGNRASNSTYRIGREAIEQSQASSLGELLQLIPGQRVQNAPLQSAQTINFRSQFAAEAGADEPFSRNNAFGIGIYVNDQPLNNNANMQGLNPISSSAGSGATGRGFEALGGTNRFNENTYDEGETPGGGFDLREIPVGNIEEVEVVQGVSSAKYGDITEGAIHVETVAGRSPLNLNLRHTGGNTNVSADRGFRLSNSHALNVSADYLYSNADPRDRIKSYNRIGGSLLWTGYFGTRNRIQNTMRVSYRTTLDDFQVDPDLGTAKRVYYRNRRFSASNRLRISQDTPLFDRITVNAGITAGSSVSHQDRFVNPGVQPVTGSKEEGAHTGTYHPANYRTTREIRGQPLSVNLRLDIDRSFAYGEWAHTVTYGATSSLEANYGEGRVLNPLRPLTFSGGSGAERPESYEEMEPQLWQAGGYVENTVEGPLWGRTLRASLGLRTDVQNQRASYSPRLNMRYDVSETISLNGGYGIQVKAPGLIHLYPGTDYQDYPLLNYYTGSLRESVYQVYTRTRTNLTQELGPTTSYRREIGAAYNHKGFTINATLFYNTTKDGFSTRVEPDILELPEYEVTGFNEDGSPQVAETGTDRVLTTQGFVTNSLRTSNWGVELTGNTPRIEAIQTTLNFSVAFYNSYYFDNSENIDLTRRGEVQPSDDILYGIYPPSERRSGRINALVTSTHHFSELGFILNLKSEAFLYNYTQRLGSSNRPLAYINGDLERAEIAPEEQTDPRFDVLDRDPVEGSFSRDPRFVYFNVHLNLSKELGDAARLSFFANNFLNIRPEATSPDGQSVRTLNEPPYFGMSLALTL